MSVDERLRTALQHEMLPGTDTAGAYGHVLHGTRRRAARRRAVVAAAVVALAAASGLTAMQPWQDQRVEPATPPPAHDIVVPAPQSTTEELEGHWAARGWVDFDRMAATVRAAGLGRWV